MKIIVFLLLIYSCTKHRYKVGECIYMIDRRYVPPKITSIYKVTKREKDKLFLAIYNNNRWEYPNPTTEKKLHEGRIFYYRPGECPDNDFRKRPTEQKFKMNDILKEIRNWNKRN